MGCTERKEDSKLLFTFHSWAASVCNGVVQKLSPASDCYHQIENPIVTPDYKVCSCRREFQFPFIYSASSSRQEQEVCINTGKHRRRRQEELVEHPINAHSPLLGKIINLRCLAESRLAGWLLVEVNTQWISRSISPSSASHAHNVNTGSSVCSTT